MKPIVLTSPAGAGSNYAVVILNWGFSTISRHNGHMREGIEVDIPQITILRNPFDCIASGAERWLKETEHRSFKYRDDLIELDDLDRIRKSITWEEARYIEFFKDIDQLPNVKVFSFELLTENPKKFLEEVKVFFNREEDIKTFEDEKVFARVIKDGNVNRIPREHKQGRKIIDEMIQEMYQKETWEAWKIYSELKAKLDAEGL
jgi:hypothetical protein